MATAEACCVALRSAQCYLQFLKTELYDYVEEFLIDDFHGDSEMKLMYDVQSKNDGDRRSWRKDRVNVAELLAEKEVRNSD